MRFIEKTKQYIHKLCLVSPLYRKINKVDSSIIKQEMLIDNITSKINQININLLKIDDLLARQHSDSRFITEELLLSRNEDIEIMHYRLAVFIVNYNMPERTDALYDHLKNYENWPMDIYVIDNGSDIKKPSQYTNVFIKKNVQTCRGWLRGLEEAKKSQKKYFAYMFLITSTGFEQNKSQIDLMMSFLIKHPNAVGIHPSLSSNSTTAWKHLINRGFNRPRKTWMIDNIASIFRADWFDSIGWFDKDMIYAWGIDLETCYIARKQGRDLYVDDRVEVEKITNVGYKMKRMNMKAEQREQLADANMKAVLIKKYGDNYHKIIFESFVEKDLL